MDAEIFGTPRDCRSAMAASTWDHALEKDTMTFDRKSYAVTCYAIRKDITVSIARDCWGLPHLRQRWHRWCALVDAHINNTARGVRMNPLDGEIPLRRDGLRQCSMWLTICSNLCCRVTSRPPKSSIAGAMLRHSLTSVGRGQHPLVFAINFFSSCQVTVHPRSRTLLLCTISRRSAALRTGEEPFFGLGFESIAFDFPLARLFVESLTLALLLASLLTVPDFTGDFILGTWQRCLNTHLFDDRPVSVQQQQNVISPM